MKDIINVSDEAIELMGGYISIFVEPVFKTGDCKLYALRLSKENIKPYAEPNLEDIEDEVWNFARTINYMGYDDFISCFGGKTEEKVYELSYSEAKAEYEAWKKQKDEIRVGDEVKLFGRAKGLVYIVGEEMLEGVYSNCDRLIPFCWRKKDCIKTGKHFPEITELLKKIRFNNCNFEDRI